MVFPKIYETNNIRYCFTKILNNRKFIFVEI